MREMYQKFVEVGRDAAQLAQTYTEDNDPFFDPAEERLIGRALVYMDSIRYLLEIDETTPVIDYKGKQEGELLLEIVPRSHREEGSNLMEDLDDGQVEDMVGKKMWLRFKIVGARGLPQKLCQNTRVTFKFWGDAEPRTTAVCPNRTINPKFNYSEDIEVVVTKGFVSFISNDAMEFEVWGCPDEESKKTLRESRFPQRGGKNKNAKGGGGKGRSAGSELDALDEELDGGGGGGGGSGSGSGSASGGGGGRGGGGGGGGGGDGGAAAEEWHRKADAAESKLGETSSTLAQTRADLEAVQAERDALNRRVASLEEKVSSLASTKSDSEPRNARPTPSVEAQYQAEQARAVAAETARMQMLLDEMQGELDAKREDVTRLKRDVRHAQRRVEDLEERPPESAACALQ